MVHPLTRLLRKDTPFCWTQACQEAFEEIKSRLIKAPILVPLDWSKPFHVHVDASHTTVGAILYQANEKKVDHPTFYASCNLINTKKHYTTIEKECLTQIVPLFVA